MTEKSNLANRIKEELDLVNLHLNLAKMDAKEDWEKEKQKISVTFQNIKRFFDDKFGKHEEEHVRKEAVHIRTKAEVMESIMALRQEKEDIENAKRQAEVDQLDADASKILNEMSDNIDTFLNKKEIEQFKSEFKEKFDNKLNLVKKYVELQDEYMAIQDKKDDMEFEDYIKNLESQKAELEQQQAEAEGEE